jgi:hypothetical protein
VVLLGCEALVLISIQCWVEWCPESVSSPSKAPLVSEIGLDLMNVWCQTIG